MRGGGRGCVHTNKDIDDDGDRSLGGETKLIIVPSVISKCYKIFVNKIRAKQ